MVSQILSKYQGVPEEAQSSPVASTFVGAYQCRSLLSCLSARLPAPPWFLSVHYKLGLVFLSLYMAASGLAGPLWSHPATFKQILDPLGKLTQLPVTSSGAMRMGGGKQNKIKGSSCSVLVPHTQLAEQLLPTAAF